MIEKTLKPNSVTVHFSLNDVSHVVRRRSDPPEVLLKVGDSEFRPVREDDIRELLPIQAYSQKQLSAVGVRTEELIRFIEAPIAKDLARFRTAVEDLKAKIRSSYGLIIRKRQVQKQVDRKGIELESLSQQLAALKGRLKDLSPEDRDVLSRHELFLREAQLLNTWRDEVAKLEESVQATLEGMQHLPTPLQEGDRINDEALIRRIALATSALFDQARQHLNAVSALLSAESEAATAVQDARDLWQVKWDAHEQQYKEVRERAQSQKALLDEIAAAEIRIQTLQTEITRQKGEVTTRGTPEAGYDEARQAWTGVYRERGDLVESRCAQMTELSSGALRATLRRGARADGAKTLLTVVLDGTGVRQQARKIENLVNAVSGAANPVEEWSRILSEFERLAVFDREEEASATLPECPLLGAAEFTSQECERIASQLTVDRWLELSLVELDDEAVFEYRQRERDYIQFGDASAGQQATALLTVLLNQSGPPLIIDQPEEDLDNEVVLEIVREIWRAKQRRQIIVTSHNANIVVNGDADLVAVCAYRISGDQSGGRIKAEGAIDVGGIRKEIELVMEGGRDAFRLRMDKYGF